MSSQYDDRDDLAVRESAEVDVVPAYGTPPTDEPLDLERTETDGALEVWEQRLPDRYQPRVYASVLDRPILPPKDEIAEWAQAIRGGIEYRSRLAAIHGVRSWIYILRALSFAPAGAGKFMSAWSRWMLEADNRDELKALQKDGTVPSDARVNTRERGQDGIDKRVKRNLITSAIAVVIVLVAWIVLWHTSHLATYAAAVVILVVLGICGSRREQIAPIMVETATQQRLTPDSIIDAYYRAKITKNDTGPVRILGVPHRVGPGLLIRVEAPGGTTMETITKARAALASALYTPTQCLEFDCLDEDAESLHEVYIADQPLSKVQLPAWPLTVAQHADIFQPIPIGWSPRGELITLSLLWVHTLLGAAPRRGKSTILRLIACAVLLDPRADLIICDFGGGREFKPIRRFAKKVIHGSSPNEVAEFAALLQTLRAEHDRRMAILDSLSDEDCPDGRLTPALAERPDLRPIIVITDEFHEVTTSEQGEDIVRDWVKLKKICAKTGITFVDATQAADESVPTELRNCSLQRIALSMASYQASMAILGNTAQKLGYDASKIGSTPGIGIMWGVDSTDFVGHKGKVRFANLRVIDASAIMQRVSRTRSDAGVQATVTDLPVAAIDDEPAAPVVPPIVRDVLRVWPRPQMSAHAEYLSARLEIPDQNLRKLMIGVGLKPEPVRMLAPGATKTNVARGWHLADIEAVTATP